MGGKERVGCSWPVSRVKLMKIVNIRCISGSASARRFVAWSNCARLLIRTSSSWTAPLFCVIASLNPVGEANLSWLGRQFRRCFTPSVSGMKATEDRQDDAQADCQPRQGTGHLSRAVCPLFSQSLRFRPVQSLHPGVVVERATQERRGHRPRIRHRPTHTPAVRRVDQVGRTGGPR